MASVTSQGLSMTYGSGYTVQSGKGIGQVINQIKKSANKIGSSKIISKALNAAGNVSAIVSPDIGDQFKAAANTARQGGLGKKRMK